MTSPYLTGPNALERNPAIEPQYFQPSVFIIFDIANGPTTTVTFTTSHNYVIGQLIRFVIPSFNGIRQINQQIAYVISIPSPTQVIVDLNSTQFDQFNPSPLITTTPPQVVAVGDNNFGLISSTGRSLPTTAIPGSFINISPI